MLNPEYKPLSVILERKLFNIPEYQRHYSWQTKQRNDLFEDIKKSILSQNDSQKKNHFMATIVCLKTKETVLIGGYYFDKYDIVDGQQRLTTLVILLKAISKELGDNVVATDLNRLLFKSECSLPILKSNHDKNDILCNYLQNGNHPSINNNDKSHADNNLAKAIKECEDFVKSEIINPLDLLCFINNNLHFIFLSMVDESAVYTVFEVLNSRGLDVDWLDKCKSLLMGLLYEKTNNVSNDNTFNNHLKVIHQHWANIYATIGIRKIQGYEVVRFSATLKNIDKDLRKVMSPESALDFFKEDCISVEKIIETTKYIEEVVLCLSKLYDDEKLKAVTDVSQARLLAVSIMLKYNNENNKKDREKLLDQWERTSFKIYTLFRKDSRSEVGSYISAASQVQQGTKSPSEILKVITDIGKKDGVDLFDINKIDEEFKKDWYNGYRKDIRYFFFKYEEFLKKPNQEIWYGKEGIWNSTVDETIEHVLPQNLNEYWSHFSKDEHKKYLNSIGNLCMLSQGDNSKAGDKPFSKKDKKDNCKKDIYLKNLGIESVSEIYYTNEKERVVWNKKAIEERTERLLKFAKEQWKDLNV